MLCACDLAGELMKFGDLNPILFFSQWRSPAAIWAQGGPWVLGVRKALPALR